MPPAKYKIDIDRAIVEPLKEPQVMVTSYVGGDRTFAGLQ